MLKLFGDLSPKLGDLSPVFRCPGLGFAWNFEERRVGIDSPRFKSFLDLLAVIGFFSFFLTYYTSCCTGGVGVGETVTSLFGLVTERSFLDLSRFLVIFLKRGTCGFL
jgi:hypothetical protein